MKIILSRKGFDSGYGQMPSPILPDGTLLSMPIPVKNGAITYHDIYHNNKCYYKILHELNPKQAERLIKDGGYCHVDPDLQNRYKCQPANWKPAFGQHGTAQNHLKHHQVDIGDVFLFYGWFRQTKFDDTGKLRFVDSSEEKTLDKHIIFGYMEIGEIITEQSRIRKDFFYHPHAGSGYTLNNTLYLASKHFLNTTRSGCGILMNAPIRQLTKEGHSRSEWNLPECFYNLPITYHKGTYGWVNNYEYFKSASKGQEFIVESEVEGKLKEWLLDVITI